MARKSRPVQFWSKNSDLQCVVPRPSCGTTGRHHVGVEDPRVVATNVVPRSEEVAEAVRVVAGRAAPSEGDATATARTVRVKWPVQLLSTNNDHNNFSCIGYMVRIHKPELPRKALGYYISLSTCGGRMEYVSGVFSLFSPDCDL